MRPVVLVHGIWDDARSLSPLRQALGQGGFPWVEAVDLSPATGLVSLERLGEQVAAAVERARARTSAEHVDLVGFSMGALVSRLYLALLGGRDVVRRFVSISGPHQGTWTAYALPFPGIRQMRPDSPLLRRLGPDVGALGDVAVHCIYTPFDATIIPPRSGVIEGARSVHRVPVAIHRWMLSDPRVLALVVAILREREAA
jgi:triacylglycerol esterase/lipase EstA (alpha/beta hydrolase family)